MSYETLDIAQELINSEQLQIFDVYETYCVDCDDITPHHFDSPKFYQENSEDFELTQTSSPLSQKNCVVCRKIEENKLDA